ncbi:MAG TPA: hypothetical protein VGM39_15080 [Kofleriaceae bacterium]
MTESQRPRPFAASICHRCAHLRIVESGKGSTFLMCREPTLPKYPPQPVVACGKFTPAT